MYLKKRVSFATLTCNRNDLSKEVKSHTLKEVNELTKKNDLFQYSQLI